MNYVLLKWMCLLKGKYKNIRESVCNRWGGGICNKDS